MDQNPSSIQLRIQNLVNFIHSQFMARTVTEGKKTGKDYGIKLDTELKEHTWWITFSTTTQSYSVTVPLPFVKNGILLLSQNEVERPACSFFFEKTNTKVDYISAIYYILFDNPAGIIPRSFIRRIPFIQQIIYSFQNGNTATIIHNLQRAINEVINKMPLHQTQLSSWVMNHRLLIVDSQFDSLQNPIDRLDYQIMKAKKYFDVGWTSLGLSDGSLADKNYILSTDIRKLTPFGIRYHNPGRNLFSTLKMKGDELPLIRTESMRKLMDSGITRTGWNWFTAFIDIPDNFEDQIIVDKSHIGTKLAYKKRVQCFGEVVISEGDTIKHNQPLCILPDGETTRFDTPVDKAVVKKITETITNVGNTPTIVKNVIIKYTRVLKEGFKITNTHGNKGVIRFKNLGYAVDPRNDKKRKIDVIVSATSIKKRKNYGQLLEALLNTVSGDTPLVISDNFFQPVTEIYNGLQKRGFRKDGTWDCDTYAGKFRGVCGSVFWGVIESVEDTVWDRNETIRKNGKGLRNAGLKFSHIEIRALETRFGPDNPIISEIMTYAQGAENLYEQLNILRSKIGILPKNKPIVDVKHVLPVNQINGTIVPTETVSGTVVDEDYFKDGFILKLPVIYQVLIDKEDKVIYEGQPQPLNQDDNSPLYNEIVYFDNIYIPNSILRACWRHPTGKYGLNDIGVLINNLVVLCHRYIADPQKVINLTMLYRAIYTYFNKVTRMMSTKRGDVSVYGMAVRYPLSAKARATLSNILPKNNIEIHRNMANQLNVKPGDVVLVERFPCLGFMSIRPQKIRITDDPQCKYVIRVSKNSLGSLNLDFDGDNIFIAAFHSQAAKTALKNEHDNPNKTCYSAIRLLNKKSGVPHTKAMGLPDYKVIPFDYLNNESHANHVKNLTSVKAQTGPVVALTYNIMRLVENSGLKHNRKLDVAVELFLDKVANSVFQQKHGQESLHEKVTNAICVGNVETMVEEGFDKNTTTTICNIIKKKANSLGVSNLIEYHEKVKKSGGSIISRIVKSENHIYYASRADLECTEFLKALNSSVVDIPSKIFKWITLGRTTNKKTQLELLFDKKALSKLHTLNYRDACGTMINYVESILTPIDRREAFSEHMSKYAITDAKFNIRKLV